MFPEGSTERNQSVQIRLWLNWKSSYRKEKKKRNKIQNETQIAKKKKDSLYNRFGGGGR